MRPFFLAVMAAILLFVVFGLFSAQGSVHVGLLLAAGGALIVFVVVVWAVLAGIVWLFKPR